MLKLVLIVYFCGLIIVYFSWRDGFKGLNKSKYIGIGRFF